MMKHRSSTDLFPSDYLFSVHPASLEFQRQYKTRFHFYFQKNLQIISKHQCPLESVKKDQIVQFKMSQHTPHFRVQSQKNLDYSWSLYIFRVDMVGNKEQFIEGQKITLQEEWSLFKSKKQSLFEKSVKFNTIRCKLNYIVVIGHSNQQVMSVTQKYYEQKTSAITTYQKVLPVDWQKQAKKVQKNKTVPQQNNPNYNIEQIEQISSPQRQMISKTKGIHDMKISPIVQQGNHTLQQKFSPQPKQRKSLEYLLSPREEQNIKLSNSELEIGQQIQEIVITKEASLKEQNISKMQQLKKAGDQVEERNIRMTNSQILNQKKQVIEPLYKQKRFAIAFVLLIIFIFASGYWALARIGPKLQSSKQKKGKKVREQTKQVPKKKGRGKK